MLQFFIFYSPEYLTKPIVRSKNLAVETNAIPGRYGFINSTKEAFRRGADQKSQTCAKQIVVFTVHSREDNGEFPFVFKSLSGRGFNQDSSRVVTGK